jgi:ubiquinone/menaquinone biosynthesis C-methylase UbiE
MKAKEVKEFFERVASDWDAMRLAYYDERVIEKMAEVSGIGEVSEVADVGTGTGFVAAGLAPRVKRVVGIDNAPAMLEVARKNLQALGASNVDLVVGEASRLPLGAERWTRRSPTWSCITPRTRRRCCARWPAP